MKYTLKQWRQLKGYTQEEMAKKLDVSTVSLSKWENGQVSPRMKYIQKMADIFGVDVTDIILP